MHGLERRSRNDRGRKQFGSCSPARWAQTDVADLSWLAWPSVVTILGGGAITMFRANIAKLIDRTDKGKVPGVEFSAPTQPQVATDPEEHALPAAAAVALPAPVEAVAGLPAAGPLVEQVEATLRAELQGRSADDASGQLTVAVRALALARLLMAHEANYRVIFSTQIMLLKAVNDGSIRSTTKTQFWYGIFHERLPDAPITFDAWLGFLENCGYLIVGERVPGAPSSLTIDPFGRDFLLWMVHNGISEARPG